MSNRAAATTERWTGDAMRARLRKRYRSERLFKLVGLGAVGLSLAFLAFLLVTNDLLPKTSQVTLIHGFLGLSFLVMCATVVINLVVGALDKQGKFELGDRIDRRCRWAFPIAYFGILLVDLGAVFLFF